MPTVTLSLSFYLRKVIDFSIKHFSIFESYLILQTIRNVCKVRLHFNLDIIFFMYLFILLGHVFGPGVIMSK